MGNKQGGVAEDPKLAKLREEEAANEAVAAGAQAELAKLMAEVGKLDMAGMGDGDLSEGDDEGGGGDADGDGDVQLNPEDFKDPTILRDLKALGGDVRDVMGATSRSDMLVLAKKLAVSPNLTKKQIAQRILDNEKNIVAANSRAQLLARKDPAQAQRARSLVTVLEKKRSRFVEDAVDVEEDDAEDELAGMTAEEMEEMKALGWEPPQKKKAAKPFSIPPAVGEMIQKLDGVLREESSALTDRMVANEKEVFRNKALAVELTKAGDKTEAKKFYAIYLEGEKKRKAMLEEAEGILAAAAEEAEAEALAAAEEEAEAAAAAEGDDGDAELTEEDMNDPEMLRQMQALAMSAGIALPEERLAEEAAKAAVAPSVEAPPATETAQEVVEPEQPGRADVETPKAPEEEEKAAEVQQKQEPAAAAAAVPEVVPEVVVAETGPEAPVVVEVKEVKALAGVPEVVARLEAYAAEAAAVGGPQAEAAAACLAGLRGASESVVALRQKEAGLRTPEAKLERMRVLKEIKTAEGGVPALLKAAEEAMAVALPKPAPKQQPKEEKQEQKEQPAAPAKPTTPTESAKPAAPATPDAPAKPAAPATPAQAPVEPAKPAAPVAPTPKDDTPEAQPLQRQSYTAEVRRSILLVLRTHDAIASYSSDTLLEVSRRAESTVAVVKRIAEAEEQDHDQLQACMRTVQVLDESLDSAGVEAYKDPGAATEVLDSTCQLFRMYDPAFTSFWTHQQASLASKHLSGPVTSPEEWDALCGQVGADPAQGISFGITCGGYLDGTQNPVADLQVCRLSFDIDRSLKATKKKMDEGDIAAAKKLGAEVKALKAKRQAAQENPCPLPPPYVPEPAAKPAAQPSGVQTLDVPSQPQPATAQSAPASGAEEARLQKINKLFTMYDSDKTGHWNYKQATLAAKHLDGQQMSESDWAQACAALGTDPAVGLPEEVVCQGYIDGVDDIHRDLHVVELTLKINRMLVAAKAETDAAKRKQLVEEVKKVRTGREVFIETYVPPPPPQPLVPEETLAQVGRLFNIFDKGQTGVWSLKQMNLKRKYCEEQAMTEAAWAALCTRLGTGAAGGGMTQANLVEVYAEGDLKLAARDLSLVEAQVRIAEATKKALAARDAKDMDKVAVHVQEANTLKKLKQELVTKFAGLAPAPKFAPLSSVAPAKQKLIQALFSTYDANKSGFWNAKQAAAAASHCGGKPPTAEDFAAQCKDMGYDPAKGLPLEVVCEEYIAGSGDIESDLKLSRLSIEIGNKTNAAVRAKKAGDTATATSLLRERRVLEEEKRQILA